MRTCWCLQYKLFPIITEKILNDVIENCAIPLQTEHAGISPLLTHNKSTPAFCLQLLRLQFAAKATAVSDLRLPIALRCKLSLCSPQ